VNEQQKIQTHIGTIVTNLQSLEFALRLLLYELERVEKQCPASNLEFHQLRENDWIEENPLTNYDSLEIVINKCNAEMDKRDESEHIDKSLVNLRDAFAHGRVLSLQPMGPFRLLKFSRPNHGKVQVIFCVEMTPEWIKSQVRRTYEEVQKVVKLGRKLGLTCFSE